MASRRMASRRSLTGSLGDVNRRLKYLEARPSFSRLSNYVVQRQNIRPRSVATDQIALSSVTNDLIEAETIKQDRLAADSVGNSELQPNSVDSENFVPQGVDTNALQDGSVTNDKLGPGSVQNNNLGNNSVDETKLASGSVGTDQLKDSSVTNSKIADGAVTSPKIGNGAVNSDKLAVSAVTENKISGGAVTGNKISDGAVTSSKIGSNAVTNSKIENGAINSDKISSGAVVGSKIGFQAITREKIASGTGIVTAVTVAAGGIIISNSAESYGRAYSVSARFGSGSRDVAPGNHSHSGETQGPSSGLFHRHDFSTSTLRAKKEVSDHVVEDLEKILSVKLKRFKYKNSKRREQDSINREWMFGYLAEDLVAAGFEEVVGYDSEGNANSVNYGLISVFALEVVKKQQEEIDALKKKIEDMK